MDNFLKSRTGIVIVSIIWGLGIASLFRRVCVNNNCIVIRGPNSDDVRETIYRNRRKCYRFNPYVVKCCQGVKCNVEN